MALAQAEALAREQARVMAQITALEKKLLALRHKLRFGKMIIPRRPQDQIRAVGVTAGEREVAQQFAQPVSGLGAAEGFVSVIKKPIVWGSALAFVGVFALRMYLKKRRAAAPAV